VAKEKEQQAFANLSEAAFKLISSKRYAPADRILEFALSLENVDVAEDVRQRLVVNRASALRHMGRVDKANDVLDVVDWSASAEIFKLCVASVRGDGETVAALLPTVKAAGAIDARTFKDWPCFSFVKQDPAVRTAFEKQFGESLPNPPAKTVPRSLDEGAEQGDKTVH